MANFDASGNVLSATWHVDLADPVGGTSIGVDEIQLRGTVGGTNLATSGAGTATCSSAGSNPANAVAGTAGAFTATGPVRWTFTFSSPVTIREAAVIARNDVSYTQAPQTVSVFCAGDRGAKAFMGISQGITWTQGATRTLATRAALGLARAVRAASMLFVNS